MINTVGELKIVLEHFDPEAKIRVNKVWRIDQVDPSPASTDPVSIKALIPPCDPQPAATS